MAFHKHVIDWFFELKNKVTTGTLTVETVLYDTTGVYRFNPDSCSEVLVYNGDNTLNTDTYTEPVTGYKYRQTYTYSGGLLVGVSGWVKIP